MTTITPNGYIIITAPRKASAPALQRRLRREARISFWWREPGTSSSVAASLRDKYRVRVEVLVKDLALAPSAADVAAHCAGFSVDGLINNAGFGLGDQFAREPLDRVIEMLNLNIVTLTTLTHLLIPSLRKSRYQSRFQCLPSHR